MNLNKKKLVGLAFFLVYHLWIKMISCLTIIHSIHRCLDSQNFLRFLRNLQGFLKFLIKEDELGFVFKQF